MRWYRLIAPANEVMSHPQFRSSPTIEFITRVLRDFGEQTRGQILAWFVDGTFCHQSALRDLENMVQLKFVEVRVGTEAEEAIEEVRREREQQSTKELRAKRELARPSLHEIDKELYRLNHMLQSSIPVLAGTFVWYSEVTEEYVFQLPGIGARSEPTEEQPSVESQPPESEAAPAIEAAQPARESEALRPIALAAAS